MSNGLLGLGAYFSAPAPPATGVAGGLVELARALKASSDANAIAQEVLTYVHTAGGHRSYWRAGIASDWQGRLFRDHCVWRPGRLWVVREAPSSEVARLTERLLMGAGLDGGPGGGDANTKFVYAYLKVSSTRI